MSGMGWRGGKRRVVAVAGAASVVLGFLSALVLVPLLATGASWNAGATTSAVAAPLLVVGGFIVMWEALVTWPDDGSPYPLRRRVKFAAAVLVTGVVYAPILLLHGALRSFLPHTWWGETIAQLVAIYVGIAVLQQGWRRLRAMHWLQGPSPSDQHG